MSHNMTRSNRVEWRRSGASRARVGPNRDWIGIMDACLLPGNLGDGYDLCVAICRRAVIDVISYIYIYVELKCIFVSRNPKGNLPVVLRFAVTVILNNSLIPKKIRSR